MKTEPQQVAADGFRPDGNRVGPPKVKEAYTYPWFIAKKPVFDFSQKQVFSVISPAKPVRFHGVD